MIKLEKKSHVNDDRHNLFVNVALGMFIAILFNDSRWELLVDSAIFTAVIYALRFIWNKLNGRDSGGGDSGSGFGGGFGGDDFTGFFGGGSDFGGGHGFGGDGGGGS